MNKRFRWIAYLESMNVKVFYIPGKDNIVSDFISRNLKEEQVWTAIDVGVVDFELTNYSMNELLIEQLNDCEIKTVIDYLQKKSKVGEIPKYFRKHLSKLSIVDELLCYNHHGNMLIVTPKTLRDEILELGHSQFYSGHFGTFKTHRRILGSAWWPDMFNNIRNKLRNCKICVMVNAQKKNCVLGKRPFPNKPLDLISIDFIVELPLSNGNNKHILTVVDNFTKHLKVYAVKDRTAKTAAKCIYDYVLTFGIPLKLYSDRDPAYEAELFQELMKLLGVKKLRTTGYNAKANGLCEKLNGIVKQYLLKYTNFVGKEWDQWLRELCYAYNSSVNSSTGFTPAELMFGRNLRIPMDILYGLSFNDREKLFSMKEFREKLSKMYELAAESVNQRQIKSKSYYDAKVNDDKLDVNTLVYIYLPRKQRMKLELKWDGPYKVISAKHPVYEIEINNDRTQSKWLTRDKLRRCEKGVIHPKRKPDLVEINNKIERNEDIESDSDSDSSIERNENEPRGNVRYELRRNINLPDRYGDYIVHYAKVLF